MHALILFGLPHLQFGQNEKARELFSKMEEKGIAGNEYRSSFGTLFIQPLQKRKYFFSIIEILRNFRHPALNFKPKKKKSDEALR